MGAHKLTAAFFLLVHLLTIFLCAQIIAAPSFEGMVKALAVVTLILSFILAIPAVAVSVRR